VHLYVVVELMVDPAVEGSALAAPRHLRRLRPDLRPPTCGRARSSRTPAGRDR